MGEKKVLSILKTIKKEGTFVPCFHLQHMCPLCTKPPLTTPPLIILAIALNR